MTVKVSGRRTDIAGVTSMPDNETPENGPLAIEENSRTFETVAPFTSPVIRTSTPTLRHPRSVRMLASAAALFIGASVALTACQNAPDENTAAKILPADTRAFVTVA